MAERPTYGTPEHGGISKQVVQQEENNVIEDISSVTIPDHGGVIPPKVNYIEEAP
jgi:hypothetical protein